MRPQGRSVTANVHYCAQYDCCYHLRPGDVELIEMVAQGVRNKQVACRLQVSLLTVRSRVYRVCRLLGVPNRPSLVRRAFELGLLTTECAEPYFGNYQVPPLDLEMVEQFSRGLGIEQIAAAQCRSPQTIKNHLFALYREWNASDRASLVRRAIEMGLLKVGSEREVNPSLRPAR